MSLEEKVRAHLAAGDLRGAATEVIEGHGPATLRYLRSVLRIEADAADAFSQWAERVWLGLPRFRFDASLKTWCFRLAWSVSQDLRSEAWRRRGQRLATSQAAALAESIRTASEVVHQRQRLALEELSAALSDEERSLLALRIEQELTWEEMAAVVAAEGPPVAAATLAKRFERIKARLGALARERGMLPDGP